MNDLGDFRKKKILERKGSGREEEILLHGHYQMVALIASGS